MNAVRQAYFTALLERDRRRALRVIKRARATVPAGVARAMPGEESAPGSVGAAAVDDDAIVAREAAAIAEIDRALPRLRETPDQFGICAVCGKEIPLTRIEVVPATPYCALHAVTRDGASSGDGARLTAPGRAPEHRSVPSARA